LFGLGIHRNQHDRLFSFDLIDDAISATLAFSRIRIANPHLENFHVQAGYSISRQRARSK
jgi:hypothetical protein